MLPISFKLIYLLLILTVNPYTFIADENGLRPYSHEEIVPVPTPGHAALLLFARELNSQPGTEIKGFLYQVELRSGFVAEVPLPEINSSYPEPKFDKPELPSGLTLLE